MASRIGSARLRAVLVVAALSVTACSGSAGSANDAFNPSSMSPTPSAAASTALPTPSLPAVDVAGQAVGYPSKTLLAPPPSPVIAGVKVILRANVSVSGRLHATGSVTFTDGPRVLGTAALLAVHSSGQAELVVALPSGPNVIVAHYLGDTTVAASASTPVAVAVSASATTVTATVKPKAKTPAHVVLAIDVKGVKPAPPGAGYVTVYVDGGAFSVRLDAHGHASVALTLSTGYHSIVVTFPGDSYLNPGRASVSYVA